MTTDLIDRLASLSTLAGIPREELGWLVKYGRLEYHALGTVVGPKGKPIDYLYIILSGKLAIRVDRGAGPKLVEEWASGAVSGMLPYSRMKGAPGNTYVVEKLEALALNVKHFPQMITHCPTFTALTVHIMLDRARRFNTSDLQDEKMLSLGKLAAGLAHELNNPASATVRNAKLLLEGLASIDDAWQALVTARLSDEQFKQIMEMRSACLSKSGKMSLTPIQKADHQDKISHWLTRRQLDPVFAASLADTAVTTGDLNNLMVIIPQNKLDVVLKWIAASCSTKMLAVEMELAAGHIYKLVDAVKKFTYMDNLGEKEFIRIEPGIRDTLSVLISKTKSKMVSITLEIEKNLPQVYANGSDLNQVWYGLIDNALDAVPLSGNIRIEACSELNRVLVRIIDDGPGIPSDNVSRIFDPFFTTKPPGQGTGLGLDITRRLLRRYNGDISVNSQPGRTEFCVSLVVEK